MIHHNYRSRKITITEAQAVAVLTELNELLNIAFKHLPADEIEDRKTTVQQFRAILSGGKNAKQNIKP